ncbi:MAG: hypothetical protein JSW66_13920 [Phycisphaerales bacterium]|nr:MAG: hypothetical protein JSW66_13920 [Phycisphaerales bacterium]
MQSHKRRFVIGKRYRIFLFVAGVLLSEASLSPSWPQEMSDWYRFAPRNTAEPGEIGMQDWLDKPAGLHGRIVRRGDKLFCAGRAIKLWGLNNTYSACAPAKDLADKRAAFYPKYGINSVRLHKYADGTGWAGIQSVESFVEFDANALDRMDYYVARLKENGIYVKLSSTFGVKLGPGDGQYVPYMSEFGQIRGNRLRTGHGSIYLSRELQDLQIQQIVNILEHANPYTQLTYAQDPAVAVVELFNEDSALWFGVMPILQKVPTLRERTATRFSDWLKAGYGSHEGLVKAWGSAAIDSFENEGFAGEHLDERNIAPAGNPWFYDPTQLAGSQAHKKQRLFDTMLFLYEIQNEFYDRYVQAIRATGYEGEILGSNWQAGRAFSHYYNLHSDFRVGLIDRHNYFGGARRGLKPGTFDNASMLCAAGSAMLSAGMQQVSDRPFMLSEWIHVVPNEWGAEGPAIIGAYGMGLNGWDVSYMFQNSDVGGFSDKLGGHPWEVTAPQVLGVFPAVARQVLRGDIAESDVLARRLVHVPSLHEGQLGFEDRAVQQNDVKTFDSDRVPAGTLAVARCVVEFTERYQDTPVFDLEPYRSNGALVSSTDQLCWYEGQSELNGYFTMDTDATKAVVGFARDKACTLGDVTIKPKCRFAAIYVTAAERNKDIGTSTKLLIVAVARARNTGQQFNEAEDELLQPGAGPVLMEPVEAEITIRKPGNPQVIVLDHDGLPTGRGIPVADGTFTIDGARDKTPYYVVRY